MTIYEYCIAQAEAAAERAEGGEQAEAPPDRRLTAGISIAGDLGGEPIRVVGHSQRDKRRKWVRAA